MKINKIYIENPCLFQWRFDLHRWGTVTALEFHYHINNDLDMGFQVEQWTLTSMLMMMIVVTYAEPGAIDLALSPKSMTRNNN